ncbi:MAG: MBL fold metallo-hydrolase [Elusimicrobiales bacterium]|nr:MBL fold metallo-hydrolase [Elusimicrobiales bacterium]
MMKTDFLGTNGWYDSAAGNTTCALVETAREYVVLDAGFGIHKLDAYVKPGKPVYIFISHPHIDHICGLHVLGKFRFRQGVKIFVSREMVSPLKKFAAPPYSAPLSRLGMKAGIADFAALKRLAPHMSVYSLRHSIACYGLRIEDGGKILAYAPDTGLCPNAYKLADKADALIAECSYHPGERRADWPHLNPEDGAFLAKKCGVKKFYMTHFEARRYPDLSSRRGAQRAARKIFRNSFAARDGVSFSV